MAREKVIKNSANEGDGGDMPSVAKKWANNYMNVKRDQAAAESHQKGGFGGGGRAGEHKQPGTNDERAACVYRGATAREGRLLAQSFHAVGDLFCHACNQTGTIRRDTV